MQEKMPKGCCCFRSRTRLLEMGTVGLEYSFDLFDFCVALFGGGAGVESVHMAEHVGEDDVKLIVSGTCHGAAFEQGVDFARHGLSEFFWWALLD